VPVVDEVANYVDQRIRVTDFSAEMTLTRDTVPVNVDAIAFWMVWDAEKSVLEIEDFVNAVTLSAQTGSMSIVPSTAVETMGLGAMGGLTAFASSASVACKLARPERCDSRSAARETRSSSGRHSTLSGVTTPIPEERANEPTPVGGSESLARCTRTRPGTTDDCARRAIRMGEVALQRGLATPFSFAAQSFPARRAPPGKAGAASNPSAPAVSRVGAPHRPVRGSNHVQR
jgi:hypothetical protein